MLILSVFVFFITIFALLYENTGYKHQNFDAGDVIRSFAGYTRAHGHLPLNDGLNKDKIPWNLLGISENFFKTPQKTDKNYAILDQKYLNKNLLQFDSLRWILKFCSARFHTIDIGNLKLASIVDSDFAKEAFWIELDIGGQKTQLTISKSELIKYANFEEIHGKWLFVFSESSSESEGFGRSGFGSGNGQKKMQNISYDFLVYPNTKALWIKAIA